MSGREFSIPRDGVPVTLPVRLQFDGEANTGTIEVKAKGDNMEDLRNDLTNEERETHLNMSAGDRATWEVYTDDPVMDREIRKKGGVFVEGDDRGRLYTMERNQVRFFRPITDEQRQRSREQAEARGFGVQTDEGHEDRHDA